MIADKTGIPRETVRRRVDELVAAGLLLVDSDDKLRSATFLGDPECQRAIDSARRAIRLSQKRLSDVDCSSGG
jgi:DNA-binding IclR family transcriptional regulator